MAGALERCTQVYGFDHESNSEGNCEIIIEDFDKNDSERSTVTSTANLSDYHKSNLVPFVTRKCPSDYKRYACCKCVRTCKSVDMHPKKPDGTLTDEIDDNN